MAAIAAFGVMMNKLDKQALRKAALNAKTAGEAQVMPFDQRIDALNAFTKLLTPVTAIALLDENEALEKRAVELTAENADLKHPGTYLPSKIDTPETDAFTNEMQAQGVERCAAWFQDNHEYCRLLVTMMREFAQKLRDGKV